MISEVSTYARDSFVYTVRLCCRSFHRTCCWLLAARHNSDNRASVQHRLLPLRSVRLPGEDRAGYYPEAACPQWDRLSAVFPPAFLQAGCFASVVSGVQSPADAVVLYVPVGRKRSCCFSCSLRRNGNRCRQEIPETPCRKRYV